MRGRRPTVDIPEAIGPYRILELLGEGSMGRVYLGERAEPFRRRVAIKVVKLGLDTREVVARFEAERETLARMDHRGIARVHDAGATADGRPYFVMEHVPGVPITEHCDREKSPLGERLALFAETCEAIQHAHEKGILHRDIKPSNVLVTLAEGRPTPKVIDFGLARAMDERPSGRTLFTRRGQVLGTPVYMSPEQADQAPLDARTDIYSLGVVFYELVCGVLPFDKERLAKAGYAAMRRTLREEDPPRPSARLAALPPERRGELARLRRTDPRGHLRALRDDLDWIAAKALEKSRAHRYATASELALDIARHLRNLPVTAGPPSRAYRLRKFVRRHRAAVVAGSMLALALNAGVTTSATWTQSARRDEAAALDLAAIQLRLRAEAERERDAARAALALLQDALAAAGASAGEDARVTSALAAAERDLGERLRGLPGEAAAAHLALARAWRSLGRDADSERNLRAAIAILQAVSSDESETLAAAREELARNLEGRGEGAR